MKISELLLILVKALNEHGDVEVVKVCGDHTVPITKATFVTDSTRPIRL